MKSVDRDFGPKGLAEANWFVAYFLVAASAIFMLVELWKGIHPSWLSTHILFEAVSLSLIFVLPLISAFQFRRYIKNALKVNLVSERFANNCEYLIGNLVSSVYLTIMLLAVLN